MAKTKYRTAPEPITGMPRGIPYIIGNEVAERFSFYGMRAILTIFMVHYLVDRNGVLSVMTEGDAKKYFHWFLAAVYFTPFLGSLLSDIWLGKYRTIINLSILYCIGNFFLAFDHTRLGLAVGLILIVVGSGGIKPCVSSNVGDQFGKTNHHLLAKVFSWFYFGINVGSVLSMGLTPYLLEKFGPVHGPTVAFGVPGILMVAATFVFWLGRKKYVHVPAGGLGFVKQTFSGEGIKAVGKLAVIYVFVAPFWSLFDQTGSSWILQAEKLNLHWLGFDWLPSQVQIVNSALVLILIPVFSYGVYPLVGKVVRVTPLRKMAVGFFISAVAFAIIAWVEQRLAAGEMPSVGWQAFAYLPLTIGEVLISITCLEFSYTQAPKKMKSFIMAIFLMSVTVGNLFTAQVNSFIQNEDGTTKLEGASYYWFFVSVITVTGVLFGIYARFYKEKVYIQDEEDTANEDQTQATFDD